MSDKTSQTRQLEKLNRAERLLATIATIEAQIEKISASGEVAPGVIKSDGIKRSRPESEANKYPNPD